MAYDAALLRPELVSGIVAIGGRLLKESMAQADIGNVNHLELLIVHSDNDAVLDFSYAQEAHHYFQILDVNTTTHWHTQGHSYPNNLQEKLHGILEDWDR